jgi:hypothetical protein
MAGALDLFDYPVDISTEEWAERLADKILECLHRQENPVLRRRYLAVQLKLLRTTVLKEVMKQLEGEGK